MIALVAMLVFLVLRMGWWMLGSHAGRRKRGSACRHVRIRAGAAYNAKRFKPKPRWVTREVLRLKALMPNEGCRKIADAFNRRFELHWSRTLRMTVGRSFVYGKVKAYGLEIIRLRRELKHRVPRPLPRNLIWAMDLTEVPDADGSRRLVLGVLDHGSRAVVALCEMADKRSITTHPNLFCTGVFAHLRCLMIELNCAVDQSVFIKQFGRHTKTLPKYSLPE